MHAAIANRTRYPAPWMPAMLRVRGVRAAVVAADHRVTRETDGGAGPARDEKTSAAHPLALRVPPLALTLLAALGAWGIAGIFPSLGFDLLSLRVMGGMFAVVGVASSLLGVVAFRRARTTVNPLNPAEATSLVDSGIFRYTRNPMYLGFLCCLLGVLAWLGNPIAWIVAPAFVTYLNRFQIGPEECALRERFGARFIAYAAHVPRWL